jgi:penicillin-binding protein activator
MERRHQESAAQDEVVRSDKKQSLRRFPPQDDSRSINTLTSRILMTHTFLRAAAAIMLVAAGACTAAIGAGSSTGSGALAPQYVDPTVATAGISGIGFESQDIREMCDKMVRDLLAQPRFARATPSPRIIIDDSRFKNESNQMVNLNLLVDRVRIELMRASQGRILFVSRQNVDLVEKEKQLKTSGRVDEGAAEASRAIAGADYQLIGKIASQTTMSNKTGVRANYYQFSFEMLDLNNGLSVWGNLYDLKKAGADDRIYR